ncbi:hypothetical protein BOTBODRAFT_519102 [Botryobasidium botryosum FD-172 SS1]|uniref:Uncharacterized protein n=1 Tax=Botryobasidium botryosum (strain FD-172 SS1) TaxID=930990 RepID=A0A067N4K7_BOTB1|nr:hypothetical protein BOTBODRAFT_519102 [Botryobasidium botryosum FD-172 SS1]
MFDGSSRARRRRLPQWVRTSSPIPVAMPQGRGLQTSTGMDRPFLVIFTTIRLMSGAVCRGRCCTYSVAACGVGCWWSLQQLSWAHKEVRYSLLGRAFSSNPVPYSRPTINSRLLRRK